MKTKQDLAELILAMNYGEFVSVGEDFASMIDSEVRPQIVTQKDFCEMLFDWAEAQRTGTKS